MLCLRTIAAQSRGEVVKLWRLAVPPCLAIAVSVILLAGVFDATLTHDAEWLVGAIVGGLIGRAQGWRVPMHADQLSGLVRLRPTSGGSAAAVGLVILAIIDFVSAALQDPIAPPDAIAACAAFLGGYLGCRAVVIAVRAAKEPHVELHHHAAKS